MMIDGKIADSFSAAEAAVGVHFEQFENLLKSAEKFAKKEQWSTSAVHCQIAAQHAYCNHAGLWTSTRLERLLTEIGQKSLRKCNRPFNNPRSQPSQVLHVLTAAYSLGGHTRTVWRWIRQDSARSHSVALTGQAGLAVPQHLAAAVRESGGRLIFLDDAFGGVLRRASLLRKIATEFDRIVLHVHPYDVVPMLAFCESGDRPPLIFVNHADHTFWLGVGISDIVLHLRDSGISVSKKLRGIESRRCLTLPVPLSLLNRKLSREQAKEQLGLAKDAIVLFTVASAYKYEPILGEQSFLDTLVPILQEERSAALLAVGPRPEGQWERANQDTNGRVIACGSRGDIATFYQAADIYLDPFPFASTTSFLEAGSYGSPLLSFNPFSDEGAVLGADSPELEKIMVRATDFKDYRKKLINLIRSRDYRVAVGEQTKQAIVEAHVGKNWNDSLEAIYSAAAVVPPAHVCSTPEKLKILPLDVRVASISANSGISRTVSDLATEYVGLLPFLQRSKFWAVQRSPHPLLFFRLVMLEWVRQKLRPCLVWKRRRLSQEAVVA